MDTIKLTPGEKENVILALKHYRDFLSQVEQAIWEDDGAWLREQLFASYLPPPAHQKLGDALWALYDATRHLVEVELENDTYEEDGDISLPPNCS